jgi:dTDP-4-dehydrorhamnose 3,5-epimerase-like enzyme
MKTRNIFNSFSKNLQTFSDERGIISDIFYKENIEHAALIESKPNVVRGNHYHKETTQHMIITQGSLEYWYKNYNTDDKPKMVELKKGDFITTPPLEIHALKIGPSGNQFIVFTEGLRGGADYEKDTYRVPSIIK